MLCWFPKTLSSQSHDSSESKMAAGSQLLVFTFLGLFISSFAADFIAYESENGVVKIQKGTGKL